MFPKYIAPFNSKTANLSAEEPPVNMEPQKASTPKRSGTGYETAFEVFYVPTWSPPDANGVRLVDLDASVPYSWHLTVTTTHPTAGGENQRK